MEKRVLEYMKQYDMLPENGNLVVGVSGGADSVCLLLVLARLSAQIDLHPCVVHVDHGLRKEAGEDAAYVESLCKAWEVPFFLVKADVESLSRKWGISCEEAGRQVRYQAFRERLAAMDEKTGGHGCIAVAHNRDDRAETFLFHLLRGTGLDGMAGIRPVREVTDAQPAWPVEQTEAAFAKTGGVVRVVRPLLFAGRDEIEAFLKKEGVGWRTDATNAQDLYTRNRIRNHLLPYARENICSAAGEHLAREAQLLADTADFVRARMLEALERCMKPEADCGKNGGGGGKTAAYRPQGATGGTAAAPALTKQIRLLTDRLQKEEPYLQSLCIRECMQRVGRSKNLTAAHIEAVRALAAPECTSGRRFVLPACRVAAVREFGTLVIFSYEEEGGRVADTGLEVQKAQPGGKAPDPGACKEQPRGSGGEPAPTALVSVPGRFFIPGLGMVETEILPGPAKKVKKNADTAFFSENIPEKKYTKWFDYDKISKSIEFRTRQQGDYLTINEALDKKSLKRYMIEEKIPADRRDSVVLLADGPHIIWVTGHRISAAYKVSAATETILQVTVLPAGIV